jgi:peptidoglycan/xylan/chitin deacetylase (PgdA/CDA1 family)
MFWLRTPAGRTDLLRILAYHGISDPKGFELQLRHLKDAYQPITAGDVLRAFDGSRLPPRSVWVTFDDGDPSVVEHGIDALNRHGIEATLFVCPGLIDTSEPYWWQVVDAAAEKGLSYSGRLVTTETRLQLKKVRDSERRKVIRQIRKLVEDSLGWPFAWQQLESSQLAAWIEAGHRVGNHTWDHPLLDRCNPDQQEHQIVASHRWLSDRLSEPPALFAYPNGNWSQTAEDIVIQLGYRAALLFDHRLAQPTDPLRLSRLRTRADSNLDRFRAVVSGIHPELYRIARRN